MKRFIGILFLFCMSVNTVFSAEFVKHPIELEREACLAVAVTGKDIDRCSMKAVWEWNKEIDKYYSLLYKKFEGDQRTEIFESQKYWVMYKNNEFKIINGLTSKGVENVDKTDYRGSRKQEIMKERASTLRKYYTLTFEDPEKEMMSIDEKNSVSVPSRSVTMPDCVYNLIRFFKGSY